MTPSRIPSRCRQPLRSCLGAAALLCTLIAAPAGGASPDSVALPTLAGVWTLDVKKSDSAREKLGELRAPGGRMRGGPGGMGGGGMRGGPRGGGRPPGGPGGGPEDEQRRAPQGPEMRLMMRPPASMLIEQTDSTVVLFEQGLPIEVLVLGLPQDRAGTVEPTALHVTASWSGRRLLALREDEPGGRMSQHFAMSEDGRTFTLTLRREPADDRPPVEIRRVYRRDE